MENSKNTNTKMDDVGIKKNHKESVKFLTEQGCERM
jgi:hypothetical protein